MALVACHPVDRAPTIAPTALALARPPSLPAPVPPVVSFDLPSGFTEAWGTGFVAVGAKDPAVLVGCVDAHEIPLEDYILEANSAAWTVGPTLGRRKSSSGRDGLASEVAAVRINERELLTVYVHETREPPMADVLLRTVARPGEVPAIATPAGWTRRRARCDGREGTLVDLDVPATLLAPNTFHVTRTAPTGGHHEVDMEVSLLAPNEKQRPAGALRYEQPCNVRKRFDLELGGKSADLVECDRPSYGFSVLVASARTDDGATVELRAQSDVQSIEDLATLVRSWARTMVFRTDPP